MPYIAGYLLKLSVSLSVVYLFYILVLRRLTFYNWNRWYLLGYSLLAFFIPFVNISPVLEQSDWDKNLVIQLIPVFGRLDITSQHDSQNAGIAWWSFLLAGALVGIVLMLVRFLVRYTSYLRIRRSANLMVDAGVKVYHVDQSIIPFSFGNAIFINPQLHSEEDLKQIIHHEFIHVKQRHTIDILWSELLCMLNWYNPFAWLIKKAIRQNLEFIADHKVLENGIDKKHYQYLLLKVTDAAHFSITQQFNFSSLKKRIVMMNKSRSAKIQLTRFLFLLPLVTILLLAFRSNVIAQKYDLDIMVDKSDLKKFVAENFTVAYADTTPAKPKIDSFKKELILKNLAFKVVKLKKPGADSAVSEIVVYRRDGITENYDWNDAQAQALFKKRYGALPGTQDEVVTIMGKITKDSANFIDASLNGPGNLYLRRPQADPLIVVDGIVQDGIDKLNDIDPNSIESMSVIKDENAVKTYGEKAKNGVIEISLKKGFRLSGTVDSVSLYIVDGVEMTPAEFAKMNIDPEKIESIEVLKNEHAVRLYGEKARNGVIIIKLKRVLTLKPNNNIINIIGGYTYAKAASNSIAMSKSVIKTVIIDDRFYTVDEANRLFKPAEFKSVGAFDAKTIQKVHGRNEPAIVFLREDADYNKYGLPKVVSVDQP